MDEQTNRASVFGQMAEDGSIMAAALESQAMRALSPESVRVLRSYTSAEVAELLGISVTHLRNLHHQKRISLPESEPAGRRLYTAAEIHSMRVELAAKSRNPLKYLPKRDSGREHLQVLSCCSFKGGSGKSSSALMMSQRLSLRGYRVLAIDFDPQASFSTFMGMRPEIDLYAEGSVYDAIRYRDPVPMRDIIRKTHFHNLDLAASSLVLAEYDIETPIAIRNNVVPPFFLRLKEAIGQVAEDYDVVIIDCPPQMSYLTMSAMIAATAIVVPVVPGMIDVASLAQFMRMSTSMLEVIRESGYDFDYDFMRYLLARFTPSDGPQAQMAGFLRAHYGERVMTEPFLMSTAIGDAGLTNNTLYEMSRGDYTRSTYDRAIESMNKVVGELEELIWRAWGRI